MCVFVFVCVCVRVRCTNRYGTARHTGTGIQVLADPTVLSSSVFHLFWAATRRSTVRLFGSGEEVKEAAMNRWHSDQKDLHLRGMYAVVELWRRDVEGVLGTALKNNCSVTVSVFYLQ